MCIKMIYFCSSQRQYSILHSIQCYDIVGWVTWQPAKILPITPKALLWKLWKMETKEKLANPNSSGRKLFECRSNSSRIKLQHKSSQYNTITSSQRNMMRGRIVGGIFSCGKILLCTVRLIDHTKLFWHKNCDKLTNMQTRLRPTPETQQSLASWDWKSKGPGGHHLFSIC